MPILCYEISGDSSPNERSTTGAEDGHIAAVLKGDHQETSAQLYSELAANRLSMFLGVPVLVGVPAMRSVETTALRFAALRAAEAGLDIYDFTDEDRGDGGGRTGAPHIRSRPQCLAGGAPDSSLRALQRGAPPFESADEVTSGVQT